MKYYKRYGLEFNPFIKNESNDYLVETSIYKESITRLKYLLKVRGFGLLTGEAGCGKTTTLRHWINSLDKSKYEAFYVSFSTVTVEQFYYQLADILGLELCNKKTSNFKNIQNLLYGLSVNKRKIPILILDEANYMTSYIFNDLKMLFNFNMDSEDHAVIILAGLPTLNLMLNNKAYEPLRQRIAISCIVDRINQKEAKEYILDKLKGAGVIHEVFNERALNTIVDYGNGTLRLIDKLCNFSLLIGNKFKKDIIDETIVLNAIEEVD